MAAIGVTGHRFLAEPDRIVRRVDQALRRIAGAFPGQAFTVISCLAEGADRLVAGRILDRCAARLVVPLPLSLPDYMADFVSAESRAEFLDLLSRAEELIVLPPARTRDQAYGAGDAYILDHSDVLIAVWDGQEPRGQVGTGRNVAEARRRGLPLVWIHTHENRPGAEERTWPGEKEEGVTFECFPAPAAQG